jgi:hypothetical protein
MIHLCLSFKRHCNLCGYSSKAIKRSDWYKIGK